MDTKGVFGYNSEREGKGREEKVVEWEVMEGEG